MISLDDVLQAAARIDGHAHRTPLMTSASLDARVGGQIFMKCENFQRTGAFKFRGAFNTIASMSPDERARGVFAYSSGNHSQAVALSAKLMNIPATILMPHDAPAEKVAATAGYGAEIITYNRYTEDRGAVGDAIAEERELPLIRPFDDPRIIAGAGTVALEVLDDVADLDVFMTPISGGGLLAGSATTVEERQPKTSVIGVEPEAGDDWARSLSAGERTRIEVPRTIADGLQAEIPGEVTWPIVQSKVDGVVTVSDAEIIAAMRFLFERCKLVVEPSGAVTIAALLAGKLDVTGKRVAVVLSGGNIGVDRFRELLAA